MKALLRGQHVSALHRPALAKVWLNTTAHHKLATYSVASLLAESGKDFHGVVRLGERQKQTSAVINVIIITAIPNQIICGPEARVNWFKFVHPAGQKDNRLSTLTFTHASNLELPVHRTCMFELGPWEEAGAPGENPRRQRENAQTHRERPKTELNPQPSCFFCLLFMNPHCGLP